MIPHRGLEHGAGPPPPSGLPPLSPAHSSLPLTTMPTPLAASRAVTSTSVEPTFFRYSKAPSNWAMLCKGDRGRRSVGDVAGEGKEGEPALGSGPQHSHRSTPCHTAHVRIAGMQPPHILIPRHRCCCAVRRHASPCMPPPPCMVTPTLIFSSMTYSSSFGRCSRAFAGNCMIEIHDTAL